MSVIGPRPGLWNQDILTAGGTLQKENLMYYGIPESKCKAAESGRDEGEDCIACVYSGRVGEDRKLMYIDK